MRVHFRGADGGGSHILYIIEVKKTLPHGGFLPRIETEFGMSQQSASRFMSVAIEYEDKLPNLGNLRAMTESGV